MILNSVVTVQNGLSKVTYVSGDSWSWTGIVLPAFLQLAGQNVDQTIYWIADMDTDNGEWLELAVPWPGPTTQNQPVTIMTDFTPHMKLPLANPGDVNIAELWNRAMLLLDTSPAATVPLHGPTHIGTGVDPVPLATGAASGLLGVLSGNPSDYVGGDNRCHPISGLPTGTVVMFAGSSLPQYFLWCDGAAQSRTTYANLYAVLGGTASRWGQGDGSSTFNTPDFRGRGPVGAGVGVNLSSRVVGDIFGEEMHLLTTAEIPAHTHTYTFDQWLATGGILGFTSNLDVQQLVRGQSGTTSSFGGGLGHNNMQPSAVCNFIIRI